MLISYQWLKELLGVDPGAERLAALLTAGGLEVEGLEHVGAHLRPVRVAKVVSSRPHPGSKNPLTLVTVDLGGESLEVVCGAPNVPAPGGLVCFAPVGAQVFDRKGQPFTLIEKPVAGIVSKGMLCAEDELGLGTDHEGILVLARGKPGESLLDAEPTLEDWILTVNVTPNRPDALGHFGVARDAAALLGVPFRPPLPPPPKRVAPRAEADALTVRVEDAERCPRYAAALLTGVTVAPSPLWLRARLTRLGVRPISNVVDVTALVMLEQGQPLHAFDDAQVHKRTLVVRRARAGEPLQTLDGVARALDADDLVIADPDRALALAGVMGGQDSGVQAHTQRVLLESAFFDPRGIRRTARRHGIHSEASHRFEREVDLSGIPRALAAAVYWIVELAGATLAGEPVDDYAAPRERRSVSVRPSRIAHVLGIPAPKNTRAILEALGFELTGESEDRLSFAVPLHRPDVSREIDLIEEVARIHGYDKIPSVLPPTAGARAGAVGDYALRRELRGACTALGLDEAVNYAFIAPRAVAALGLGSQPVARIANPLSEDRSVMRPSLLPGLLAAAAHAQRHSVPRVRLFELGTVFFPDNPPEPGLLREVTHLGAVIAGPRDSYLARPEDVDFFDGKGFVEALVERVTRREAEFSTEGAPPPWAHPRRFAHVSVNGARLGTLAELHPDVREALDLGRAVVALELEIAPLLAAVRLPEGRAPGRFPTMRRDVALLVPRSAPAGTIADTLRRAAGALCERVEIFDRYAGKGIAEGHQSLAFALYFRSDERTLKDEEVDAWTKSALAAATEAFGATQR